MTWLAVLAGGAIGSAARHGVNLAATHWFPAMSVPYATAVVNMIGSLLIGLLAGGLASERIALGPEARALVFTGLLGGFTTFSSFMLDSLLLAQAGRTTSSAANLIGQVVVGLLLVYLGFRIGLGSGR